MKSITQIILGTVLSLLPAAGLFADSSLPAAAPYVVKDAEIRVLPRTNPDRQYQLYIGLPASFVKEPTRKYPVVFVTDGYYDFTTVVAACGNMVSDKTLPEMIIVGLGYAGENLNYESLRTIDLGPPVQYRVAGMDTPLFGQGDQFLAMIEQTAIPLLEREYRADPEHRILMGSSYGGQFALYTLFTKPQLFQGYVAAAPMVTALWQYEENFAHSGQTTDAKVFITIGALDTPNLHHNVTLFNQRLAKRNYLKGGYQFRELEGMRHAGAKTETYTRGLQSVCESFAPEHGVTAERFSVPTKSMFEIHFNAVASLPGEAAWSAEQQDTMRRHRQWLDDSLKAYQIFFYVRTPDRNAKNFSTTGLFAGDQAEAEKLAATDPAVVAGLMTFEAVRLTEKAAPPPAK